MLASNAAGLDPQGISALGLLGLLSGLSAQVWAAEGVGASAPGRVVASAKTAGQARAADLDFDIPAQALTAALKQYAGLTLQSTMFSSDLAVYPVFILPRNPSVAQYCGAGAS